MAVTGHSDQKVAIDAAVLPFPAADLSHLAVHSSCLPFRLLRISICPVLYTAHLLFNLITTILIDN